MIGLDLIPNIEPLSLLKDWGLHRIDWKQLGQIAALCMITAFVYYRFVRRSQIEPLMKGGLVGLTFFTVLWALAFYFGLDLLATVLGASLQIMILALIVIFQPELRRLLFYLGNPERLGEKLISLAPPERKASLLIDELVESVRFLSKSKIGALIVLESESNLGGNYLEAGTAIDAELSTELLLTIFHPNTPLHDGAVIINANNRIVAAGVLLPLTEDPKLSWQYGTRHRAAIGLTELSDSRCLVVSEETGTISLTEDGQLTKIVGADELRKHLLKLYKVSPVSSVKDGDKVLAFGQRLSKILPQSWQKIVMGRMVANASSTSESSSSSTKKAGGGGTTLS